jgi:hypothetical protein
MDLDAPSNLDFDLAKINVLAGLLPRLSKNTLQRVLRRHQVKFSTTDSVSCLRRHLKGYFRTLRRGKQLEDKVRHKELDLQHKQSERDSELASLRANWPRVISSKRKQLIVEVFNSLISKDALAMFE